MGGEICKDAEVGPGEPPQAITQIALADAGDGRVYGDEERAEPRRRHPFQYRLGAASVLQDIELECIGRPLTG